MRHVKCDKLAFINVIIATPYYIAFKGLPPQLRSNMKE